MASRTRLLGHATLHVLDGFASFVKHVSNHALKLTYDRLLPNKSWSRHQR